jgi:hypothetical protein
MILAVVVRSGGVWGVVGVMLYREEGGCGELEVGAAMEFLEVGRSRFQFGHKDSSFPLSLLRLFTTNNTTLSFNKKPPMID